MESINSKRWTTDPEYIDLLNYIIGRTENVESPISILQMAREFKEKSGAVLTVSGLVTRIVTLRTTIQSFEHIDTNTKVKVLFALSASVYAYFLGELRKDALVEVNEKNRIIHYKAADGSLELKGEHSLSAKRKLAWIERRKNGKTVKRHSNSDRGKGKESEYSEDDSDEYSGVEFGSDFSNNSMIPNEMDDYDTNYSIDDRVKLEPFRGSIQEDMNGIEEDKDVQQIPRPLQDLDEHNQIEEVTIKVKQEEPLEVKPVRTLDEYNELTEVPVKIEHEETVEVKPETSHNSKIKFFKTMKSLLLCLDTPSLSWIQSEIHQKIQKLERSDEVILNSKIVLTFELLISEITIHSVLNLSENVESVNLSNFLCYLKAAILNSKMSGVEGIVKKINKLIEKSQNKRIPMETVTNAFSDTLDVEGF